MADTKSKRRLAILGGGNIGSAIALGLVNSKRFSPGQIILTRRRVELLKDFKETGYIIETDNQAAVEEAEIVVISVEPGQLKGVLKEISPALDPGRHVIFSIVSGAQIGQIKSILETRVPVVRVMPNIAVAISESMTCIAADSTDQTALETARSIFDSVGATLVIEEELMVPATALCACGIAFFFRAIRAASQGGIEIGFHAREALQMSAQTAKGAAALLNRQKNHPETQIDLVTTPRGCTIAGLNNMEHQGFSSAMIRGILTSAEKAEKLFHPNNGED
jgi:pyrroline-5-carboxylate reductase